MTQREIAPVIIPRGSWHYSGTKGKKKKKTTFIIPRNTETQHGLAESGLNTGEENKDSTSSKPFWKITNRNLKRKKKGENSTMGSGSRLQALPTDPSWGRRGQAGS